MTKHILVTNDDGVFAPGLLALVREMQKLGRVLSWHRIETGLAVDM